MINLKLSSANAIVHTAIVPNSIIISNISDLDHILSVRLPGLPDASLLSVIVSLELLVRDSMVFPWVNEF
ncbi:MAG: hypothetical protein WKF36_11025 [Candidatus Nitrosocosmicus sp.]